MVTRINVELVWENNKDGILQRFYTDEKKRKVGPCLTFDSIGSSIDKVEIFMDGKIYEQKNGTCYWTDYNIGKQHVLTLYGTNIRTIYTGKMFRCFHFVNN